MTLEAVRGGSTTLALLAVVFALSGCGETQTEGPTRQTPRPAEAEPAEFRENPYLQGDLCALLPLEAVMAAAGGTEPISSEGDASPRASCRYVFRYKAPSGLSVQAGATIQMLNGFELERESAGEAAHDVPDLGDDAWGRAHTDSYILYARRGDLVFSVNVGGNIEGERPRVARAVAALVLAKLKPTS